MTKMRAFLFTLVLLAAGPAAAQYYPPPPPPPPGPPPMPPSSGPPGWRTPPRYVLPDPAPPNTARLQVGFAFANDAYDCWYVAGPAFNNGFGGCGYGYGGVAWPNLNAEVDIGLSHFLALTVGGNVFGGDWQGLTNTIWEPHVDVLFRSSPYSDIRGRLRLGLGLWAANVSEPGFGTSSKTGGAFRVGVGASFFARSRLGLGIDAIFEAGSLGGYYVSTVHLMIGPELHF